MDDLGGQLIRVVEQNVLAKTGDLADCEDVVVVTDNFFAVIDGATDKTGARFDQKPGGRFAAENLARALESLEANVDATTAVARLSASLLDAINESGGLESASDRPTASIVVLSAQLREVWRVGSGGFMLNHVANLGRKRLEIVGARARAARLEQLLLRGATVDELRATDPGRQMILPLLQDEHTMRNREERHALAFGAIDGTPVPSRFIKVYPVGDASSVVLASDGYPRLFESLARTEAHLLGLLARDPLRIAPPPELKGVRPGHVSFDDRAYLRLELR